MDDEREDIINHCHECGEDFDNSFQLIDHTLEDDEDFDPYLILPNGYKLMLGSLLRFLFSHADNPEQIRHITQSTYVTLFASENGYDLVDELIEDMVVKSALQRFDEELDILLSETNDDEQGGA
jgi:hypothetical protein